MNFEASAAAASSDIRTTETVTTLEPIPMAHTNQIVAHLEPQREVVPFILLFFLQKPRNSVILMIIFKNFIVCKVQNLGF